MNTPVRVALVFLALLFVSVSPLGAQEAQAAQWSVALSNPSAAVGDEIEVILTARIAPHWIVYSSDFKADLGPQPTRFLFDPADSFRPLGDIVSVNPKRKKDPTWETEFGYFEERAEFRQKIKVLKPSPTITGVIKGQLCNERDGTCTLFEEKFSR